MRRLFTITFIIIFVLSASSCATKGEPSAQGEPLTIELMSAIITDPSLDGTFVSINGCASFCDGDIPDTLATKYRMLVYSDGFCEGDIYGIIYVKQQSEATTLLGEETRNYAKMDKDWTNDSIQFMTDDYQLVSNKQLKFSGKIVFDGNTYIIENVTIHN